jgi:hypothetical protein
MIAKILECLEIQPIKVLNEDATYFNDAETAQLTVKINLIKGNIKNNLQVAFINQDLLAGHLVNFKHLEKDIFNITIKFYTGFIGGAKVHIEEYINSSFGFIGIDEESLQKLHSLKKQEYFIKYLGSYLFPDKIDAVISMCLPSNLIYKYDNKDSKKSHFMGRNKAPKLLLEPLNELKSKKIIHVATISRDDFPLVSKNNKLKKFISFHLRVNDTEQSWPEDPNDFLVVNYDNQEIDNINFISSEIESNFEYFTFMDLPGWGNINVDLLDFNDVEKEKYYSLEKIYKNLIINEYEFKDYNKIMGYPNQVQDCVSFEAQRIKNNLDYTETTFKDSAEWILLLEINPSAKEFNFYENFGDGHIYFMIRKQDFLNGIFHNVQVVVQNT